MNIHDDPNGDIMEKRTLEVVLVCLVMLVGTGCVDPRDRRPGLWLSGDAVTAPVTDWSSWICSARSGCCSQALEPQ